MKCKQFETNIFRYKKHKTKEYLPAIDICMIDRIFTKNIYMKITWLKRNTIGFKIYCFQLLMSKETK